MIEKDVQRALRFLAAGDAYLRSGAATGRMVLEAGERGAIGIGRAAVDEMVARGLCRRAGGRLAITAAGRANRRRAGAGADAFLTQHRTLEAQELADGDGPRRVTVNLDESPLRALARWRAGSTAMAAGCSPTRRSRPGNDCAPTTRAAR